MATIGSLPKEERPAVISSGKPSSDFAYVKNGIIRPIKDSINPEKGANPFPFYAAKVQGDKNLKQFSDVSGASKGGYIYIHPDPEETNRSHVFSAFGDKIKVKIGNNYSTVRDVSDDGYSISFMSVVQDKRYAYIAIGDSTMNSKLYRYDGITNNTAPIASVADNGSGKARFTTTGNHDLYDGDYVNITGTTDYNGEAVIVRISATEFDIVALSFVSTQTGTMTSHPKSGAPTTITGLNASKNIFPMDNRLGSVPVGTSSTLPQYSELSTAGDYGDFTAGTALDEGGEFSGDVGPVNFGLTHRSLHFLFADHQITIHGIKPPIYVGGSTVTDLSKDTDTIKEGFTLDGLGCPTPKGAVTGFGLLFFVDPKKGIYQYDAIRQKLTNLSKTFLPVLQDLDLSDSSIVIHPSEEFLIVTGATEAGVNQNINLIYSFQTKRWSCDYTKKVNHLLWDPVEKKLYGLGSTDPIIYEIYDGSFSTSTGSPIGIEVNTSFFDGGRRSRAKEYLNSSAEIGFEDATEDFTYEIYVNNNEAPQSSEVVDLSGFVKEVDVEPLGPWGESVAGEGFFVRDRSLIFKNHFNDDPIDDFKKISIRVTEESAFNFAVGFPEVLAIPTDDETDETS